MGGQKLVAGKSGSRIPQRDAGKMQKFCLERILRDSVYLRVVFLPFLLNCLCMPLRDDGWLLGRPSEDIKLLFIHGSLSFVTIIVTGSCDSLSYVQKNNVQVLVGTGNFVFTDITLLRKL